MMTFEESLKAHYDWLESLNRTFALIKRLDQLAQEAEDQQPKPSEKAAPQC